MSTIVSDGSSKRMFVKGAPEKLLEKCTQIRTFGNETPQTLSANQRN